MYEGMASKIDEAAKTLPENPGKTVNILVLEISEIEKPEIRGIFQYIWKSRKMGALKCCSSN